MHDMNRPYQEVYDSVQNHALRKSLENTPSHPRASLLARGSSYEVMNGPYDQQAQLPDINQSRNY
jgi:hypothetical protein